MSDKPMNSKPKVSSEAQKELDRVEKQFDAYNEQVQSMTLDRMSEAPKEEKDQQTKISSKDQQDGVYLKPTRTINCKNKFEEKYRDEYNFQKEYVRFIAENHEIMGEAITLWIKLFPGMCAEQWDIPVNKVVWAPRYVAERLKNCTYHRMSMEETKMSEVNSVGAMYGTMVIDKTVQRLNAIPATDRKSIFMGASNF